MKSRSISDKKQQTPDIKRKPSSDSGSEDVLPPILAALSGLHQGSVEVVVHEGRITYIERREREPLSLACPAAASDDRADDTA